MEMPLLKELGVNKAQPLNVGQGFLKQVLREPASHPYPDAHVLERPGCYLPNEGIWNLPRTRSWEPEAGSGGEG